jgi:hypothetical protein
LRSTTCHAAKSFIKNERGVHTATIDVRLPSCPPVHYGGSIPSSVSVNYVISWGLRAVRATFYELPVSLHTVTQ